MKKLILSGLCGLLAINSWAANICVSPSGSAGNSGADWSNTKPWDNATWVRGNTYYLADGNYGGMIFDTQVSDTNAIIIKKAIESDHGTNYGWASGMGDGQAVINDILFLDLPYFTLDGQTGGGHTSWASGHGIKISTPSGWGIRNGSDWGSVYTANKCDFVTITHIEFDGGWTTNMTENCAFSLFMNNANSLTISYCYWHNLPSTAFQSTGGVNDLMWEQNFVADGWGWDHGEGDSCHGEHIYLEYFSNCTFRNSKWARSEGWQTGVIVCGGGAGMKVYGNVIYNGGVGNSSIGNWTHLKDWVTDAVIVNNTIVDMDAAQSSGVAFLTGTDTRITIQDNLQVACVLPGFGVNGNGVTTINNNLADEPTSRFVNYAAKDYRLAGALPGVAIVGAEYLLDINGVERGRDNVWDIGAYEFESTPDTNAPVITSVTTTSTNDVGATIQWTTSESASSVVQYGIGNYNSSKTNAGEMTTSHTVNLTGLTSSSIYQNRVVSADTAGNSTNTVGTSFTTLAPDILAPTNTLVTPINGAIVTGTSNITATVTDNVGVEGVKIYVDAILQVDDTSSPYAYAWDSELSSNGTHIVWCVARDAAGNLKYSATNSVTVTNNILVIAPRLYWTLNENTGTVANDAMGSTNKLTLTSGAAWKTGRFDAGGGLDGIDDTLRASDSSSFDISNKLSMACWVNSSNVNGSIWFQIGGGASDTAGNWRYHLFGQVQSPSGWFPAWQVISSNGVAMVLDTVARSNFNYIHLVGVYNGTNVTLYVNGLSIGSTPLTGDVVASGGNQFIIGSDSSPAEFLYGTMDEIRIYNKALTASQVALLYATDFSTGSTNTAAPVINSSLTASGTNGYAITPYVITASATVVSYGATGLPTGLTRSGSTISGTPTVTGTTNSTITATNAGGYDSKTLAWTIYAPDVPTITSSLTAGGIVGQPITPYIITSSAAIVSYGASGLPGGLTRSGSTISGTPVASGITSSTITTTNGFGTDSKTLVWTVSLAPSTNGAAITDLHIGTLKF